MSIAELEIERKKGRASVKTRDFHPARSPKVVTSKQTAVARRATVKKVTGVAAENRAKVLSRIRKGLAFRAIEALEEILNTSRKDLAELLSIPVSTMTRRKGEGHLHVDESDRVVRIARLVDEAINLMDGDQEEAVQWLKTPLEILGNETPLKHANTELGARDVEDLIGRLRHGVFS